MKFCAVVCEYNPFHNGHAYQLERIRAESGCEKVLCLMSGNFTQRGEAAVADKYVRAKHAVLCGADAVLELPVAFAVAPAELFARGAVHILAGIPAVSVLAFGCESGGKEDFLAVASALSSENKAFKNALKEKMTEGGSYIRARNDVLAAFYPELDPALLASPNNILGGEYCHALLAEKSDIVPLPIPRTGGGYGDPTLLPDFSSASALRAAFEDDSRKTQKLIKKNLPAPVFADCPMRAPSGYQIAALCALIASPREKLALTPDCSEGLENRLKTLVRTNCTYGELVEKVVSRRYTRARIQRILAQNFLGITLRAVRDYIAAPLYCNVLAVKKDGAEQTLSLLGGSRYPVLVRHSDEALLKREALESYRLDQTAADHYAALTSAPSPASSTLFI